MGHRARATLDVGDGDPCGVPAAADGRHRSGLLAGVHLVHDAFGTDACPGCSYARRVVCVGRHRPLLWPLAPVLPPVVGAELARRQRALAEAKAVVAVSDYVSETLPVDNVHVVPNFCQIS